MKDTRELVDLLLSDSDLTTAIHNQEHLQAATIEVVMQIQARMTEVVAQAADITEYVPYEAPPVFPNWLTGEITATTALLVGCLDDWDRPVQQRDRAARLLQRVLFGRDHAPAEWWATLTGVNMVYAIGYTHAEVPLELATHVLLRSRGGVHWLRTNKGLQLTDRSFFDYVQGSAEWKAQARQLRPA